MKKTQIQRVSEIIIFTENDKSIWLNLNREDKVIKISDNTTNDFVKFSGDIDRLSNQSKLITKALNWAKKELND